MVPTIPSPVQTLTVSTAKERREPASDVKVVLKVSAGKKVMYQLTTTFSYLLQLTKTKTKACKLAIFVNLGIQIKKVKSVSLRFSLSNHAVHISNSINVFFSIAKVLFK